MERYSYSDEEIDRLTKRQMEFCEIIWEGEKTSYVDSTGRSKMFYGLEEGGICNLLVLSDGDEIMDFDRACYGYLKGCTYSSRVEFILTFNNGHGDWELNEDTVFKYYDWLINRSPFKYAYMPTTVEHVMKYGVIVDTNTPANYMVGSLIAFKKAFYEHNQVHLWGKLVDMGMSEDLAYVCSENLSPAYIDQSYGHWPKFESSTTCWLTLTKSGFNNFHNHDVKFTRPSYRVNNSYRGIRRFGERPSQSIGDAYIHTLFQTDVTLRRYFNGEWKKIPFMESLYENFLNYGKNSGESLVYINPFGSPTGSRSNLYNLGNHSPKNIEILFKTCNQYWPKHCPPIPNYV